MQDTNLDGRMSEDENDNNSVKNESTLKNHDDEHRATTRVDSVKPEKHGGCSTVKLRNGKFENRC